MRRSEQPVSNQAPPQEVTKGETLTTKLAGVYVACVFTIGLVWMIATPPTIFSDSVSGFLVMRSMERGAPFNHELVVDPDDIAVDDPAFSAWWTPGQYVVPMLIGTSGLDLGQSIVVTTILAWLIGVAGFGLLWRRLGFTPEVAAISVAVLVSQGYVLEWGRAYHGGELLQWSFLPWFVLLAYRFRELRWHQVAALSAALIFGISIKAAFAIVGASVILSLLWLEVREIGNPFQARARRRALGLAARLAVVGGISLAAYWAYDSQPSARSRHMGLAVARFWAYVSSGSAPAGEMSESVPGIDLREFLFAASGPLNSLFDLWKTYVPETEAFEWTASGIGVPMLAVSLASVLLLWAIVRLSGASREYLTLVVGVYIGVVFSLAIVWALNLQISFNVRHFRVVGVLFVPGIVAMLARIPSRAARQTSLALLAMLCLTFTLYYTNPLDERRLARPVGASGFSHIYAGQSAVDALSELDSQLGAGNNLIGVPWGQMALDVKNSRVFHMRTALRSADYFRYNLFSGHVDNLIVVVPIQFEERGETSRVLRAFMLHRDWRRIRPEVEDFVFMYSGKRDDFGEHPEINR